MLLQMYYVCSLLCLLLGLFHLLVFRLTAGTVSPTGVSSTHCFWLVFGICLQYFQLPNIEVLIVLDVYITRTYTCTCTYLSMFCLAVSISLALSLEMFHCSCSAGRRREGSTGEGSSRRS